MLPAGPTARVLAVLETLQERPVASGPRLAATLGVSERTVRRYVATLQDMGIPIEATRGREGGYRLRPGYRMPPLMFTTDEAVAITLALTAMQFGADSDESQPANGTAAADRALGKLNRVMPRDVATRMTTVQAAISTPADLDSVSGRAPQPALLVPLAEAVVGRRRCRLRHRSQEDVLTVREVNPYGVVALHGGWYLHGWCHLRQARRTFRIDRIERVDLLSETFSAPGGLDVVEAVEQSLALSRPEWAVTMLIQGSRQDVEPWIPRQLGVLESVESNVTRMTSSTRNLDYFVWRLSDLPFQMSVVTPAELRGAFVRHAERMLEVGRGYASPHD